MKQVFGNSRVVIGQVALSDPADPTTAGGVTAPASDLQGAAWVRPRGYSLDTFNGVSPISSLVGESDDVSTGIGGDGSTPQSFMAAAALLYGYREDLFGHSRLDRVRVRPDNADGDAPQAAGALLGAAHGWGFNGATYDRRRLQSVTNAALAAQLGLALSVPPADWSAVSTPAENVQATATMAAGGAGIAHVATRLQGTIVVAPGGNMAVVQLVLRDGASGAGAILWAVTFGGFAIAAGGDGVNIPFDFQLSKIGTAATAMTAEFTAAGGASTYESLTLSGYSVGG